MKSQSVSSLILLASGLQVAAATGFGKGGFFSCPSNTNNECNPQQNNGYDWATLQTGTTVSSYGGMAFSGWGCANSFGKRDPLAKRTFANSKCITGSAHSDKSKSSKITCGANTEVKKFSVTEMHVSVEFDCDLDFHFEMPDKSTCKQTSGCSTGGSIIKNSQCGGATGVTIVYPNKGKNSGKGKDKCDLGIHSIGFDCSPPKSTTIRSSTTTSPAKPTTTSPGKPQTTSPGKPDTTSPGKPQTTSPGKPDTTSPGKPATTSPGKPDTTSPGKPDTTSPGKPDTTSPGKPDTTSPGKPDTTSPGKPATTSPGKPDTTSTTSSFVSFGNSSTIASTTSSGFVTLSSTTAATTPVTTPASNSGASSTVVTTPAGTSPGESPSVTTPAESVTITTVVVVTTQTTCPFTSTHTTAGTTSVEVGTTVSTITVSSTITSTVCSKCTGSPTDSGAVSTTTPAGPAVTAPGVPDTLPKCMNTWNFIVGCLDNTDHSCYCPSTEFVNNVFQCLSAYGVDDKDISEAAAYFQGICAPYIPQNPAIITGCPSVAAPPPAPGAPGITPAPGVPAPGVPVTTISIQTTLTVPCVESTGVSSGLVIPSSSTLTTISTVITVPQVVFSTPTVVATGTATAAVPLLVVGTPAAVAAETTPASGNSKTSPTTIATIPVSATGARNNGTSGNPPLQANSGSSTGVAFGSMLGAALLAIFAL